LAQAFIAREMITVMQTNPTMSTRAAGHAYVIRTSFVLDDVVDAVLCALSDLPAGVFDWVRLIGGRAAALVGIAHLCHGYFAFEYAGVVQRPYQAVNAGCPSGGGKRHPYVEPPLRWIDKSSRSHRFVGITHGGARG
jgi:hypothetical protein